MKQICPCPRSPGFWASHPPAIFPRVFAGPKAFHPLNTERYNPAALIPDGASGGEGKTKDMPQDVKRGRHFLHAGGCFSGYLYRSVSHFALVRSWYRITASVSIVPQSGALKKFVYHKNTFWTKWQTNKTQFQTGEKTPVRDCFVWLFHHIGTQKSSKLVVIGIWIVIYRGFPRQISADWYGVVTLFHPWILSPQYHLQIHHRNRPHVPQLLHIVVGFAHRHSRKIPLVENINICYNQNVLICPLL